MEDSSENYNTPRDTPADRKSRIKLKNRPKKRQNYKAESKKSHQSNESMVRNTIKRIPVRGTDVWCHLCDKTFNLPRRYMVHMRNTHRPNVLSFGCDQCPKFFATEDKMRQHASSHRPADEKKIHPCPQCDRTFTRAESVQLHQRVVHMGDRPFVCEECGKACATKGALKEHQISHTDVRPIKCNDCSKCFKDIQALKRHSRSHNTSKFFECIQCGQRLNTLQTLRNHMLVHSDEKRYKCQHCGTEYKRYKTFKVGTYYIPSFVWFRFAF